MQTQEYHYTERSYRMSRWILMLLALAFLMISLNIQPLISKILFGLPIVLSGILGMAGTYLIIKGMNEPLTEKGNCPDGQPGYGGSYPGDPPEQYPLRIRRNPPQAKRFRTAIRI